MKSGYDIKKRLHELSRTTTDELDEKIKTDCCAALRKSQNSEIFQSQSNTRRIIMNYRNVKIAACVTLAIVVLGLVPVNGETVFQRISNKIGNSIARLRGTESSQEVTRQIDKSTVIRTSSRVYLSAKNSLVKEFLNEQGIHLESANSLNTEYTVLSSDKVSILQELLESSDEHRLVSAPTLLAFAGAEVGITTSRTDTSIRGIAIASTPDENTNLSVDFAFVEGEQTDGGVAEIKLNEGEALLLTNISIIEGDGSNMTGTILILPEIDTNK